MRQTSVYIDRLHRARRYSFGRAGFILLSCAQVRGCGRDGGWQPALAAEEDHDKNTNIGDHGVGWGASGDAWLGTQGREDIRGNVQHSGRCDGRLLDHCSSRTLVLRSAYERLNVRVDMARHMSWVGESLYLVDARIELSPINTRAGELSKGLRGCGVWGIAVGAG